MRSIPARTIKPTRHDRETKSSRGLSLHVRRRPKLLKLNIYCLIFFPQIAGTHSGEITHRLCNFSPLCEETHSSGIALPLSNFLPQNQATHSSGNEHRLSNSPSKSKEPKAAKISHRLCNFSPQFEGADSSGIAHPLCNFLPRLSSISVGAPLVGALSHSHLDCATEDAGETKDVET